MYKIADLVQMTELSDKTIRNYIRQGRLSGQKVDGVWLFSEDDLKKFFDDGFVKKSMFSKKQAAVEEFLGERRKKAPAVCVIYDYPAEEAAQAEAFCTRVLEAMKQRKEEVSMSYSYDNKRSTARLILTGKKSFITDILEELP